VKPGQKADHQCYKRTQTRRKTTVHVGSDAYLNRKQHPVARDRDIGVRRIGLSQDRLWLKSRKPRRTRWFNTRPAVVETGRRTALANSRAEWLQRAPARTVEQAERIRALGPGSAGRSPCVAFRVHLAGQRCLLSTPRRLASLCCSNAVVGLSLTTGRLVLTIAFARLRLLPIAVSIDRFGARNSRSRRTGCVCRIDRHAART